MAQNANEAAQAPSPGDPAAEAPRTEAQQAQAEEAVDVNPVDGTPKVSAEQAEQYRKDQDQRVGDPNAPVAREANPEFGGEGFGYGQPAE